MILLMSVIGTAFSRSSSAYLTTRGSALLNPLIMNKKNVSGKIISPRVSTPRSALRPPSAALMYSPPVLLLLAVPRLSLAHLV